MDEGGVYLCESEASSRPIWAALARPYIKHLKICTLKMFSWMQQFICEGTSL